jgi:uncharacterized protein YecE (DUF72 family)
MAKAWIGTSGFAYKEWKSKFYPKEVPAKDFLPFYASNFESVEIDGTFYRMPKENVIEAWKRNTPEDFRFALKAPQQITHFQRLKTPSVALDVWLKTIGGMGPRLGITLYQLPPNFKADFDRLGAFLDVLPREIPAAMEFRHDSWFVDECFHLLEKRNVALTIHDANENTTPIRLTAPATYVRLRRDEYTDELRAEWAARIRAWVNAGVDVFAYIKHEGNPDAPLIAKQFAAELSGPA